MREFRQKEILSNSEGDILERKTDHEREKKKFKCGIKPSSPTTMKKTSYHARKVIVNDGLCENG